MRALREQPRLVAAELAIALAALIAAVLVGSALANNGPEPAPGLRPRLERSAQLRRDQASQLQRLAAQAEQLRAELRAATRRTRARARANARLRRQLRAARADLAAAPGQ
jgi:septal ring factor EnvC (AmiA/AmiB activator)